MSAILSADDLNDFISPGVACIKPIETIPTNTDEASNPYEVTTEDKVAASNPAPATISLTDCLACSGCVTSAEAVLVSLQSHQEVLSTLDAYPSLDPRTFAQSGAQNGVNGVHGANSTFQDGKIFVASVSPQARASLAATYGITERQAGHLIAQLLTGPQGIRTGGPHGSSFTWIVDTNILREIALVAAAEEVTSALSNPLPPSSDEPGSIDTKPTKPILTSACPGWICYTEKTHPYILPHLSRLKSPQALAGTLIKSVLYHKLGVPPDKVWHLAIMPCFDKKLEASRAELMADSWLPPSAQSDSAQQVRDVDCVITARELLQLADSRGIPLSSLPLRSLPRKFHTPFPDHTLDAFLFPHHRRNSSIFPPNGDRAAGTSGGYLWHVLQTYKARNPGSSVRIERGRNVDVVEYTLRGAGGVALFKAARFYGFRNIQNLVRRLKPAKKSRLPGANSARVGGGARRPGAASAANGGVPGGKEEYAYVEVMACPGGCTNGGGQVKVADLAASGVSGGRVGESGKLLGVQAQREWLARVDEAYFSADSSSSSSPSSEEEGDGAEESSEEADEGQDDADGDVDMHTQNGNSGIHDSDAMDVDLSTENSTSINTSPSSQAGMINGIDTPHIHRVLRHWSGITGASVDALLRTSYRKVDSDVGKNAGEKNKAGGSDGGGGGDAEQQWAAGVAVAVAVGGDW